MLSIENFSLVLDDEAIARPILRDVNVTVSPGEVVGLVGESGSGKSTTAKAAVGAIPQRARVTGRVSVGGDDVLAMGEMSLRGLRTRSAAMIFQDPRTTLNPVRTVGDFLTEQLEQLGWSREKARRRTVELLESVHVSKPELRMKQYPHELSGGMLQRVVIAAALASEPKLILADEPTSALDVSTQAEIMALLEELRREHGFAVLFITHDLHLAAAACDRVYVMYAGHIVEEQPGRSLFTNARHPYTRGLLGSVPDLSGDRPLMPIAGRPLMMSEAVSGCPFVDRCDWAEEACRTWQAELIPVAPGVEAACRRLPAVAADVGPSAAVWEGGTDDRS